MANGGPTSTEALSAGSPAVAAGDGSKCPAEDQRHLARPAGHCDIGAYQRGATPTGAQTAPFGTGSGSGAPSTGVAAARRVSAHGTVRGGRRARIAFTVRAEIGQRRATFVYSDAAHHVRLGKLTVRSLAIDLTRGIATLRGTAVETAGRRHVAVTLVLVSHAGHRSLRIGLSNGYHSSGRLLTGSISFPRSTG